MNLSGPFLIAIVLVFLLLMVFVNQMSSSKIKVWLLLLFRPYKNAEFREIGANLEKHNSFYRNLSEAGKVRMIEKCFEFIYSKSLEGREGLEVTEEMHVAIAGTAAQISFGFNTSGFNHYKTIRIFPESFYSKMHDRYLKGGASTSGVLFLSWKDFMEGFADDKDKYNLGLHEMAHALRIQLKYGNDFDQRFANYVDSWEEIALPEFSRLQNGESSFLRPYAATNIEEFFAVCVEHFFEAAADFQKELPDIFNHLCFLLNLNPLNKSNDFRLEQDFIQSVNNDHSRVSFPAKVRKNYKYDTNHWSFYYILGGIFLGLTYVYHVSEWFLFPDYFFICFIVTGVAIVAGFRNYFYSKGIFLFRHLMLFGLLGVTVPALAIVLFLDQQIVVDTRVVNAKIIDYSILKDPRNKVLIYEYRVDNPYLMNYPKVLKFNAFGLELADKEFLSIDMELSTGLMGLTRVSDRKLIYRNADIPQQMP
ncbi:MAG: zinc-dependent peptidase [Bacteroidetes bacterium]|nr:zinc-dependent peptidase [Bacteroidota bacterium]